MKIITNNVRPPVPSTRYDWNAVYEGYEPGDPIGWGATEAEAMAALVLDETDRDWPISPAREGYFVKI